MEYKNPVNLNSELQKSGLVIAIERHLFIQGWNARMSGNDKPIEEKLRLQEFIEAGWIAADEHLPECVNHSDR